MTEVFLLIYWVVIFVAMLATVALLARLVFLYDEYVSLKYPLETIETPQPEKDTMDTEVKTKRRTAKKATRKKSAKKSKKKKG